MNNGWNNGYDGGMSVFGGILMMVFWAAIIVGVVLLVVWLVRQVSGEHIHGHAHAAGHGGYSHGDSAIEILNERYARGEIEKAEYEEKKKDLTG